MKRRLERLTAMLFGALPAGLAATALCVVVVAWNPQLLRDANLGLFDQFQRLAPRPSLPDTPVRVVAIDTASLDRRGQWPWPRTEIARLVRVLRELGAASIAFDVVFAEADRTSPRLMAERYEGQDPELAAALRNSPVADHDGAFAAEIARAPVVLGTFLAPQDASGERRVPPRFPASISFAGDDPSAALTRFGRIEPSLAELNAAARAVGSVSLATRRGGLIRRVPLFSTVEGRIAPALSIEALRVAIGAPGYILRSSTASGEHSGGQGPVAVDMRLGPFVTPLTAQGEFWVRYAGGTSAPVLPIWRFLDENADLEALRPEVEGRIVFVGASAPGLRDLVATPLEDQTLGVSIHAEIVEQIVTGTFLRRPDWSRGAELSLTALFGLLVTLAVALLGPLAGSLLTIAALAAVGAGAWSGFTQHGLLIAPLGPMLGALVPAMTSGTLRYAQSEQQRRAVRNQFENFVSAEVVEEIAADPARYLKPSGETRELTLLFADIRGFSRLSEGLSPEELIALLNDVLTPMAEAVIDQGGTVDKFMGDAMMAFWNAPRPVANHPAHALTAALRLQRDVGLVNQEFQSRGMPDFAVGVGVNTGACSVGSMGSRRRLDYSCIGDPVNLASRLEGLTRQYDVPICVGEATALRAPSDAFALLELDRIRVKGRDAPERVFALLGDESVAADPGFTRLRSRYAEALEAYRAQAWTDARAAFQDAGSAPVPGFDPAPLCARFVARADAFLADAPDPEWDGVWIATEK